MKKLTVKLDSKVREFKRKMTVEEAESIMLDFRKVISSKVAILEMNIEQ